MIATSLRRLVNALKTFYEKEIPERRLKNDADGRRWLLKSIDYSKDNTLKLADLREVTDRTDLNDSYIQRSKIKEEKARLGLSAIKTEISALYSFNKCFVQRFKGRLHYYRDDLSQKGKRNMRAVAQSMALFGEFKKNLDRNN
jgi:hypothetical protein